MTEPDDHSSTRPISVAELLARNGTIGAPPVGGRRRRRRGSSDSVTVAELTGEIPIVRTTDTGSQPTITPAANTDSASAAPPATAPDAPPDTAPDAPPDTASATDSATASDTEPSVEALREPAADRSAAGQSDTPAQVINDAMPEPGPDEPGVDAMAPDAADPVDTDEAAGPEIEDLDVESVFNGFDGAERTKPKATFGGTVTSDASTSATFGGTGTSDADGLPSYLRSTSEPLFGGPTVADRIAPAPPRPDDEEDDEDDDGEARPLSTIAQGSWIVAQSVIAVVFGAGLFVAFDQMWKWNNIVALVLSVLVILGLVVGVRVVRRTEDIGSTLIAVAVGALVTLGPLALLQSG